MASDEEKKFEKELSLVNENAESRLILKDFLELKRTTKKMSENEHAVVESFVQRAIASVHKMSSNAYVDQRLISDALLLVGLNAKGSQRVSDTVAADALEQLIPVAIGESEKAPLFNSEVNEVIVNYLHAPESAGFSPQVSKYLDEHLTDERKDFVLRRAVDGRAETQLSPDELTATAERHGIKMPESAKNSAPENIKNIQGAQVAQLGTHALQPDLGQMEAQAKAGAAKYQLHTNAQIEAQLSLNALMAENPSWAERRSMTKIKDLAKNKFKDTKSELLDGASLAYPRESLLGHSLSEVDSTGRVLNELVRFSTSFGSFKVKFKSPKTDEKVYQAAALMLRTKGISKPYIKCAFRAPEDAQLFLSSSVEALIEAGYDIDDIKVQPHMQPMFEQLKLSKYPDFSIEEAPEDLEIDPKQYMEQEHKATMDAEEAKIKEGGKERLDSRAPDVLAAQRLIEEIKQINDPIMAVEQALSEQQTWDNIGNKNLMAVLSKTPHLNEGANVWDIAVSEAGVSPNAKQTLLTVVAHYEKLMDLADPSIESKKIGDKQFARLVEAQDLLSEVMPHQAERLKSILAPHPHAAQTQQQGDAATQTQEQQRDNVHAQNGQQQGNWSNNDFENSEDVPDEVFHGEQLDQDELDNHHKQSMEYLENEGAEVNDRGAAINGVEVLARLKNWRVLSEIEEFSEFPQEILREITALSEAEMEIIQNNKPEGMSDDDYEMAKNAIVTVRLVTDVNATSINNFGYRELELLGNLPDDLVPQGLKKSRDEYVNMLSNNPGDAPETQPLEQMVEEDLEVSRPKR